MPRHPPPRRLPPAHAPVAPVVVWRIELWRGGAGGGTWHAEAVGPAGTEHHASLAALSAWLQRLDAPPPPPAPREPGIR